jgi:hypothetical protein
MFSGADFTMAWKVRGETSKIIVGLMLITATNFGTPLFLLKCAGPTGKDSGGAMSGRWLTSWASLSETRFRDKR